MKYASVALGGTFDRLHAGHQALLSRAFAEGEMVTIGLTTDAFVRKTKGSAQAGSGKRTPIRPYGQRKDALVRWLHAQGWEGRYRIVPLSDAFGPTVPTNADARSDGLDAIIVSDETAKTAQTINELRAKFGWKPLAVESIGMVPAKDAKPISSTRIRNREITTKGDLILPNHLRTLLRQSIGRIIPEQDLASVLSADSVGILIAIGDMTTRRLLDLHIRPNLAVIDFQTERAPYAWDRVLFERLIHEATVRELASGPGFISREAIDAMREWAQGLVEAGTQEAKSVTVFLIDGEEDLLVLPAIRVAPLGSTIVYGQPNKGMVRVEVTATSKRLAETLLAKFIRSPR